MEIIHKLRFLVKRLRGQSDRDRSRKGLAAARKSLVKNRSRKPHGLPGKLVLSLTSFPPRFPCLADTLTCILAQSVQPDRVVLWIAHADMDLLPASVKDLQKYGLAIRATDDTQPYKKIIPALEAFPDAFIVTADDDIFYPSDWLENLLAAWDRDPRQIVCHRGHRVALSPAGSPLPYKDWQSCISCVETSPLIFPTGAGGVLYPPGVFAREVMDRDKFMALCPRADDVWLYFMGRRNGAVYKKSADNRPLVTWDRSQDVALWHENATGNANDVYIANMIREYGWPV